MTFKKWVAELKGMNTRQGDLTRDILADPDFPRQATTRKAVFDYLESRLNDSQMAILEELWDVYSNS